MQIYFKKYLHSFSGHIFLAETFRKCGREMARGMHKLSDGRGTAFKAKGWIKMDMSNLAVFV